MKSKLDERCTGIHNLSATAKTLSITVVSINNYTWTELTNKFNDSISPTVSQMPIPQSCAIGNVINNQASINQPTSRPYLKKLPSLKLVIVLYWAAVTETPNKNNINTLSKTPSDAQEPLSSHYWCCHTHHTSLPWSNPKLMVLFFSSTEVISGFVFREYMQSKQLLTHALQSYTLGLSKECHVAFLVS